VTGIWNEPVNKPESTSVSTNVKPDDSNPSLGVPAKVIPFALPSAS